MNKRFYYKAIKNATNEVKIFGFNAYKNIRLEEKIKIGKEISNRNIAKKILNENVNLELISKITSIDIKELEVMKIVDLQDI